MMYSPVRWFWAPTAQPTIKYILSKKRSSSFELRPHGKTNDSFDHYTTINFIDFVAIYIYIIQHLQGLYPRWPAPCIVDYVYFHI